MSKRKYLILMAIVGLVVAIDQMTKLMIVSNFKLGESMSLIHDFFNLTLVHNQGAAFGILTNLPSAIRDPFFLVIPTLTLLVILYIFYKLSDKQRLNIYSLSLIVAGAIGNLVDRLRLGYVVDFLDFHWSAVYHFPAFNAADSAITVGVAILLVGMYLEKEQQA